MEVERTLRTGTSQTLKKAEVPRPILRQDGSRIAGPDRICSRRP
jgi:hypothetical protein